MSGSRWWSLGPATRWLRGGVGLRVGLALTILACAGDQATAPPESPAAPEQLLGGEGGILGQLLRCDPLPPTHAASVIGPGGGTLQIGPHNLVVPAGALSRTLTITADAPSDTVNSIRFEPQDLYFEAGHPARLTMSYANCPLLAKLQPKRITYTTDLLEILELLLSLDNVLLHQVSANIAHFSRYAIAW
jgi:hypothetical protein